ncbi:MAG TPA: hypothetical protein PKE04_05025, partial [Clostridia bacterium]|nr:hypothetical protein [Clostridia bacterium]
MRRPPFLQLTSKTFARFLLAYFLFFLCLAGMLVPIYQNVTRLYQQAIERESSARLENSAEALSQEIQRMEATRYSFQSSLVFRTLSAKAKPLSPRDVYQLEVMRRELQQAVDHYALTGDVVKEVGILFHNDLAVTRNRSFPSIDRYYGAFLRCEDLTQRQWLNGLAAAVANTFILPERAYLSYDGGAFRGLMIALPLQTVYRQSSLHLLFYLLDADALLAGMAPPDVLRAGAVTLRDADGAVLARHGQAEGPGVELRQEGGQAGLTVSLFIPNRLVYERMAPLRRVFLMGLVLYVLGGFLLMGLFAWHNNRPVYRIVSTLRAAGQSVDAIPRNGYAAIDASIRRMGTDLVNAQQALLEQE